MLGREKSPTSDGLFRLAVQTREVVIIAVGCFAHSVIGASAFITLSSVFQQTMGPQKVYGRISRPYLLTELDQVVRGPRHRCLKMHSCIYEENCKYNQACISEYKYMTMFE